MARQAIRKEGKKAEHEFCRLVGSASRSKNEKRGDVVVRVDDQDSYVEIKECLTANTNKGGSINQVRPMKFIPCVIRTLNRNCWYVVSPLQLIYIALAKGRGHHNEIPLECLQLSIPKGEPRFPHKRCRGDELEGVVQAAIRQGRDRDGVRVVMGELLDDLQNLRMSYNEKLARLLGG